MSYSSSDSPTLELSWEFIVPKKELRMSEETKAQNVFCKKEVISLCHSLYHGMNILKNAQGLLICNLHYGRQRKTNSSEE